MIIRAISKLKKKKKHIYKIYFWNGKLLTINTDPEFPQGESTWSDYFGINDSHFETGSVENTQMVNWYQMPSIIQAHTEKVIMEMEEGG